MSLLLPVIEVFGPTIQGEGPAIGTKTMFVRTAGCDYQCSWCDSRFTWDGTEKGRKITPQQVVDELLGKGGKGFEYVTISGGNPGLFGESLGALIDILHERGWKVGVETQGSVYQNWMATVDDLVVSPKPPSSGMGTDFAVLDRVMALPNAVAKVVVFDDADFEYARAIHQRYPKRPMFAQPGNNLLSIAGVIMEPLMKRYSWLVGKVIGDSEMNKVRVLPQLHTLIWGNKRGV